MKTIGRTVKSGAWEYLREMAVDERVKVCHELFIPVPQKLLRCLNLTHHAKIILLDIMSYMGKNNHSFPPIDDIALNCGMSHATVQKYMIELEEMRILKVHRRHNNTYYLVDELKLSGCIILSEVLHEFRRRMKGAYFVSEKQKNKFLKKMLNIDAYTEANRTLESVRATLSDDPTGGWHPVDTYRKAVKIFAEAVGEELKTAYPDVYDSADFEIVGDIKLEYANYSSNRLPY